MLVVDPHDFCCVSDRKVQAAVSKLSLLNEVDGSRDEAFHITFGGRHMSLLRSALHMHQGVKFAQPSSAAGRVAQKGTVVQETESARLHLGTPAVPVAWHAVHMCVTHAMPAPRPRQPPQRARCCYSGLSELVGSSSSALSSASHQEVSERPMRHSRSQL